VLLLLFLLQPGAAGATSVEPADLSETFWFSPSVSIKTTLPSATASTSSAFNVIIPLASLMVGALSDQPQQLLVFLHNLYQPSCNFNFCYRPLVMGLSFLKSSCLIFKL
jgi:hypothetical protein